MDRKEKLAEYEKVKETRIQKRVDIVREKFIAVIGEKYIKLMMLDSGEQELWLDIIFIEYSDSLMMLEIDIKDVLFYVRSSL